MTSSASWSGSSISRQAAFGPAGDCVSSPFTRWKIASSNAACARSRGAARPARPPKRPPCGCSRNTWWWRVARSVAATHARDRRSCVLWRDSDVPMVIRPELSNRRGAGVWAFVLALLTVGALAHVAVRMHGIQIAYDLGRERRTNTQLEEQRRRLNIEIGMLKDPDRVIGIAREKL